MQTVTDSFKDLWERVGTDGWAAEHKVVIAGVEHSGSNLLTLKTYGNLYEGVGIGNAMSRQIDLQILPQGTIPKQAEMKVYTRLSKTYIVSTRRWEVNSSGVINLSLKAGTYYVKVSDAMSMYADHKIVLPQDCPPNSEIMVRTYSNDAPEAYVEYWDEATSTLGSMVPIEVEVVAGTPISRLWQKQTSYGSLTKYDDVRVSEWLPKGIYYISTRQTNRITGVMTIHGFDAMLKSGQVWQGETVTENFPMDVNTALADICERMGVELDPRSQIDTNFPVKDFVDSLGYMTMRSVLGRIAVANAGNWVMTDEGKLRLVPMVPGTDSVDLGENAENVYPGQETLPFSRVELLNENGEIVGQAGEAEDAVTGRVLTAVNPEGTDAMAESIMGKIQGYVYYPFEAENAILTPAAELGDVVTVGGVTSVIAQETIYFDSLYTADIAAPTTDEVEDEYPYLDERTRVKRAIAGTRSEITKANDQIRLKISSEEAESLIRQEVDKITLSVSSGSGGSSFVMTYNGVVISAQTLDLHVNALNVDGDITARNLKGVAVALLTAAGLTAGQLSITGAQTADFAVDLTSNGALRLTAGYGAAYMEGASGAYVNLTGSVTTPECRLGGAVVLNSFSYGTGTPPTGTGRVYFKKRS